MIQRSRNMLIGVLTTFMICLATATSVAPQLMWCEYSNVAQVVGMTFAATISADSLYMPTFNVKVARYGLDSGLLDWETKMVGTANTEQPLQVVKSDYVFVGGGNVSALNATDGSLMWTRSVPPWNWMEWSVQRIGIVGETLCNTFTIQLANSQDYVSYIEGLNGGTGELLWQLSFDQGTNQAVVGISNAVGLDGVVYFTVLGYTATLFGVSASNGSVILNCSTSCCANAGTSLRLAPQTRRLFFTAGLGASNLLSAFDLTTSKCLWTVDPYAYFPTATLSPDESVVLTGAFHWIQAFNATDGQLLWGYNSTQSCGINSGGLGCVPSVSRNGVVYFLVQNELVGLNATNGDLVCNISSAASSSFGGVVVGEGFLAVNGLSSTCLYREQAPVELRVCTTTTCSNCTEVEVNRGCRSEGGTSIYRQCTEIGLQLSSFNNTQCTGTPLETQTMALRQCFIDPSKGSFEVASCPNE